MKGVSTWSYAPYRPFFFDRGDIDVCRLAPGETGFHCEWLGAAGPEYEIWLRPEGEGEFLVACHVEIGFQLCLQAGAEGSGQRGPDFFLPFLLGHLLALHLAIGIVVFDGKVEGGEDIVADIHLAGHDGGHGLGVGSRILVIVVAAGCKYRRNHCAAHDGCQGHK